MRAMRTISLNGGLRTESTSIYDLTKQAQESVDEAATAEARLTALKESYPKDDTGREPSDDPHWKCASSAARWTTSLIAGRDPQSGRPDSDANDSDANGQ
jgi:hypothetical protein